MPNGRRWQPRPEPPVPYWDERARRGKGAWVFYLAAGNISERVQLGADVPQHARIEAVVRARLAWEAALQAEAKRRLAERKAAAGIE